MKAKMTRFGRLQILPETQLDQYALTKWVEENNTNELKGENVIIIDSIEEDV